MTWTINWTDDALKQLRKLDKATQNNILNYLHRHVISHETPRRFGKPLRFDKQGLWRYRVSDSRIICQIKDNECLILVLQVGHRKSIYSPGKKYVLCEPEIDMYSTS